MNQNYINELKNRIDQLNEFIMQNKPMYMRDMATGKVTMTRPPESGKEYTPELQAQVEKVEQERDSLSNQLDVARSALQLQDHRRAEEVLRSNPTLFNNAKTFEEINFDEINAKISNFESRDDYLSKFKTQIEIQEQKYAEPVKAQKEFSEIAHSNDSTINYLNGLDPNIVNQIYAKKQEFVQAVKASHQMSQALAVKPKGLFAKIKFAFTRGKMEKDSRGAADRVNAIRSEIEEIAKQLPQADSMRC